MKLVRPKKFLGQHFLKDLSVAQAIADTVDACPDIPVLEVGPGMGVLTQFLLPKGREVKVAEIDFESVAYLRENFPALEPNIIEDDFLKMRLENTFEGRSFVLTGNYPYNISSQIFSSFCANFFFIRFYFFFNFFPTFRTKCSVCLYFFIAMGTNSFYF